MTELTPASIKDVIYQRFTGDEKDKLLLGLLIVCSPPSHVRDMRRHMVRVGVGSSQRVKDMFEEAKDAFTSFKEELHGKEEGSEESGSGGSGDDRVSSRPKLILTSR